MKRLLVLFAGLLVAFALALPAAAKAFPDVIPLPTAFQPEGIALGHGTTFFAGSLADGAIRAGDLRTGESDVLVAGEEGRLSVGMSFDARSGNLFVAGGTNGVGRVYDTATGALLAEYPMFSGGDFGDFINDVVVTRNAAYFTNSFAPVLYRVPLGPGGGLPDPATVEAIPLGGAWTQIPGPFVFNANGIESVANGKALIVVNSAAEALYRVDPESGAALQIDLGGETLPFGDGLALRGKYLYVVQNQLHQIAVVRLSRDLLSGTAEDVITSPLFNVPTTAAVFGNALYVVNAKFGAPPAETDYEIIRVPRR